MSGHLRLVSHEMSSVLLVVRSISVGWDVPLDANVISRPSWLLRSGSFQLQFFEGLGSTLGCNSWGFGFEGSRQPLAVNDQTEEVVPFDRRWIGLCGLATVQQVQQQCSASALSYPEGF